MPEVIERANRDHYLAGIERVRGMDGPEWARAIREAAARGFQESDFPHYKEEAWRATNIAPIVKTPFHLPNLRGTAPEPDALVHASLYDEDWAQIVFLDGVYTPAFCRPGLNQEGVRVWSLSGAFADDDAFVREYLDRYIENTNAFIRLNSASLYDGAVIRVEKNANPKRPLHILYISTGIDNQIVHPRNLIVLEPSSSATILESYIGPDDAGTYFNNVVSEIIVEDNARLERHKLVNEGDAAYHLATDRMCLGRDAYLDNCVVTLSGKIVRNELSVLLNGEGGECSLDGLYLNDGDRLIDNALNVEHAKSRCRSRMAYKGVLDDTSSAVFTGKVFVDPGSQRTDSDQLNNNLLLSDKATIDTKPQLEIFADDVKCTHGATIGSFPGELIFYFQSRGIDAARAHGILTYGFAEEIVDKIDVAPLREKLARYAFSKYSNEQ